MQEQIQEKEFYSFEQICPNMSRLIAENDGWMNTKDMVFRDEDGKVKTIQNGFTCMVGEAHGD